MTTQQLKGWRVKPEDMPEWCAVLKTELIQLRTENERLTRECQKLVGFKVEAPRLLDEIECLKAELDKWKEQCRLLTVRLNDGDKAFQNSQAEIERLKGEVERWKEAAISDDEEFKKTIVDLVRHKQLLVEAKGAFGLDSAWPLLDVLTSCGLAMRHLLGDHDCDHHGHENYSQAEVELTDKFIPKLQNLLSHINKALGETT